MTRWVVGISGWRKYPWNTSLPDEEGLAPCVDLDLGSASALFFTL